MFSDGIYIVHTFETRVHSLGLKASLLPFTFPVLSIQLPRRLEIRTKRSISQMHPFGMEVTKRENDGSNKEIK